jgi:hypothetical protein
MPSDRIDRRLVALEAAAQPAHPVRCVILTEHDPDPDDPDVFVVRIVGVKPAPRPDDV